MKRTAAIVVVLSMAAGLAGYGRSRAARNAVAEAKPELAVRSPGDLAYSPDGRLLAIGDATARELVFVAAPEGKVLLRTALGGQPGGMAWSPDGSSVCVAIPDSGALVEVDAASGRVCRRLPGCLRPVGVATVRRGGPLLVADDAASQVIAMDPATSRVTARLAVSVRPWGLAVTPDGRHAVVGHRLPAGDASDPNASASVSLIDLASARQTAEIALPANSTNLRKVAVSPDGRWAYVVHTLARATWPTTQIEYGWISANALSVIDLAQGKRRATVLLDQAGKGCADPWGVAVSPDGNSVWIGLSGTHQVERLDLARLHAELGRRAKLLAFLEQANRRGEVIGRLASERSPLVDDPASSELVVNERPSPIHGGRGCACGMGIYLPGIIRRFGLPGIGPRGLSLSPDGRTLAVAMYFSGAVAMVNAATGKVERAVSLGPQPPPDAVRRGEIAFHDARLCYQQWLSCATCHPEGRADGLNWDLMNDGVGDPKNTRSLVLSYRTAPVMASGVRTSFESAVSAGFEHILFRKGSAEVLRDVEAYLCSLRPAPSPFLVNGRLLEKARHGRKLFEDPKVGCAACHTGELLTDMKAYDVGTHAETDWRDEVKFVTPRLVELWRTGPYLHHGKAATLRDVLTTHNCQDRHGRTSHLGEADIEALVGYLRSL